MKILIIASTKDVFGKELKNELFIKGLDVYLLDFETLEMFDKNNSEDKKYSKLLEKFKNISKFSMLFRLWYIKSIIKENNFDIINIHVSRWFYLIILPWLIKQKLVITFYGSDFYRTSNFIKNIQKLLYKKAHIITFTNPLTKNSFIEYYKDFKNKSYVCRFGLKTLEFIDKNRDINKKELRKYLGYDLEKIIVTCGYNSTKEQQHEKIINNLIKLQKEILEKVQFVFPMTYGDIIHKEKIKSILNQTNLDYIVLEEFLYREDNANIKLASDIMINILETDSFSGSMQEFLYANNIIITGAWLPYEVFDNAGIQYVKINDINELYLELKRIIDSDIQTFNISKNKNIISKLSLWNNTIESWVDAYTK
ncbi:glycosyltransferase [Aliarcobacter butzleri]|uniref:glycosyltransferase n=1 Tax=Aliarcobacter butzleri TaxID=28197 RepID=UPI003AF52A98